MQIQQFTEKNIDEVIKFQEECEFLAVERSSMYWVISQFFSNTCFIVRENNQIIGVLLGFFSSVDHKTGYIHSIGISKDHRRKGIASTLINEFEKAIKKLGGSILSLTTELNNEKAIKFYEKFGFTDRKVISKAGNERILFSKKITQ